MRLPGEAISSYFGYDEPNYTDLKDGAKLVQELSDLAALQSMFAPITCFARVTERPG